MTFKKPTPPAGMPAITPKKITPTGMSTIRESVRDGVRHHDLSTRRAPSSIPEEIEHELTPPPQNVHDIGTWRAVHELKKNHDELSTDVAVMKATQVEIKSAVVTLNDKQDDQSKVLHNISGQLSVMQQYDHRDNTLKRTRAMVQETVETTTKESLADQIIREEHDAKAFKRKIWLQIATGVFSGSVITAVVAALLRYKGC